MYLGLTGGIATGKSTVAAMLVDKGARLIDADQIAREVVEPGSEVLREVAAAFGQAVLLADGSLNRAYLGKLIFQNADNRHKLNAIIHPPIRLLIRQRMEDISNREPDRLIVVDIPLMYESGLETAYPFEEIMLVYVPAPIQLKRLMLRDQLNEEEARQRISAQMPIEEKRVRADRIIDNSHSVEHTKEQIDRFWNEKGLA